MSAVTAAPARQRSRWQAVRQLFATLSASALIATLPAAPPAAAEDLFGHDISWPQCTVAEGGFALPMPPSTTQFVVIGLTNGLGFTTNPCIARQYQWTKDRGKPAQAYGMATYPTAAQLTAYGSSGPWKGTGLQARLANTGYRQAVEATTTLSGIGWKPSTVWIDVEPRPKQPWPAATTPAASANSRAVVEGYMRALRDRGYKYGFYSYTNGWKEIVTAWRAPGVPVWATAGTLDYPTEALDRCTQASFSGGKVLLSQWYNTTRDYDRTCPGYSFGTPATPSHTELYGDKDLTGNRTNDLLARHSSSGVLYVYPGNGLGTLNARVTVGSGWNSMGLITTVGDWNGDGKADVIARLNSTGDLYLYRGKGVGTFQPRIKIGSAWGNINRLSGQGDFTGDGNVDLVARTTGGTLYVYPGNGAGGFKSRITVGTGWQVMRDIVSTGDFTGDGRADLIALQSSTGQLWLYPGNGTGRFGARTQIGAGWSVMTELVGSGDFNRDRKPDLLARRSTGELYLYPGTVAGKLGTRTLVSTGWNVMNSLD